MAVDWSQFKPVSPTNAADSQPSAVDWSQFKPVEAPAAGPVASQLRTSANVDRTWGEAAIDTMTGIGQAGLSSISGVVRGLNDRAPGAAEAEREGGFVAGLLMDVGGKVYEAGLGAQRALGELAGNPYVINDANRGLQVLNARRAASAPEDAKRSDGAETFAGFLDERAARVPEVQSEKARLMASEMGQLTQAEGLGDQAFATIDYFASPFLRGDLSTGGARVSKVMESLIPSLAAGGAAAKAVGAVGAGAGIQTAAQLGTMSVMEGGGAAEGARGEVLGTPIEQLQEAPEFQAALRMTGGDPIRARALLADQAASISFGLGTGAAIGTMGLGQVFGANVAEQAVREGVGSLATGAGVRQALLGVGKSAGKEFASEFAQGASNQAAQNVGTFAAGANDSLGRGVVSAGIMEGIAGGTSGIAAQTAAEVSKRLRPIEDGEDLLGGSNVATGAPGAAEPGGLALPDDPAAEPITSAEVEALRQQQLSALQAKANGRPDQTVVDPVTGRPVTVRGEPAQALNEAERQMLEFLQKYADSPDKLARSLGRRLDDSATSGAPADTSGAAAQTSGAPNTSPAAPNIGGAAPNIQPTAPAGVSPQQGGNQQPAPAAPAQPAAETVATAPPAAQQQGVPTMITQAMKAQLRERGYTDANIRGMTPQQAWDAINAPAQPAPAPQPAQPGLVASALRPQPADDLLVDQAAAELQGMDEESPPIAGPVAIDPQPEKVRNEEVQQVPEPQLDAGAGAAEVAQQGAQGRQEEVAPAPASAPPTGIVAGALAAQSQPADPDIVEGQLPAESTFAAAREREIPSEAPPPESFIPQVLSEIGWLEKGGRMIRDPSTAISKAEQDGSNPFAGDVVGRTAWIGKPAADGTESQFWRMRPNQSLSESEASAAVKKWRQGRKLGPRQQEFIDYMLKAARDYAEQWNTERTETMRAIVELEAEGIVEERDQLRAAVRPDISPEDEREALQLDDLLRRAAAAGATREQLLDILTSQPERQQARTLWHFIKTQERDRGTDEGRPDQTARLQPEAGSRGQAEPDRSGEAAPRAAEAEPATAPAAESSAEGLTLSAPAAPPVSQQARAPSQQGGLFAPPTRGEMLEGERRRRDAERNGETATGRTDMMAGDGELFAGPRPEQVDVEQAIEAEQAASPSQGEKVEAAAAEAATSPENDRPEPTDAQRDAGNYKKGALSLHGLRISIENPAGTRRRPEWPPLAHHYGYFRGTEGKDGDHVDVFLGPDAENADLPVFVVDQVTQASRFDEHKVMLGFADEAAAREGYLANYSPGWTGLGDITQMTLADFKAWVMDPARTSKRASADQQLRQAEVPSITREQESALYEYLREQTDGDALRYQLLAQKFQRVADGRASEDDTRITLDWLQAMAEDGTEKQRLAAEGKAKAEEDAAESERIAAKRAAESLSDLRAGKADNERYALFLSTLSQPERDAISTVSGFNTRYMAFINARSAEFKAKSKGRSGDADNQAAFSAYIREWVQGQKPAESAAKPASKTPTVDRHIDVMEAVRDGTGDLEAYQQSFATVVDSPETIKAELATKTKDELLRAGGRNFYARYKGEKKDAIIDAFYRDLVSEYALGKSYGPTSYYMTRGGMAEHERLKTQALRELVAGQTAETLAEFAAEVKAARAEYSERLAARKQAIQEPKSLEDFRQAMSFHMGQGKTQEEAFLEFTPEQRIRYDELAAESTRDAREARKRVTRASVRAAGQTTSGQIIETKHTREGYDLFVVQLSDRLSREDYQTMLGSAKKLGGWYSSFRGRGAVAGFQFKDRGSAEAFLQLAGGDAQAAQAQADQRRDAFEDDRSQSAVERLREMADRIEQRAEEALGVDRKVNTDRRARMAASAEAAAQSEKALARTMRNIAAAIEAGDAKFLDEVRTKSQVELLAAEVRTAKYDELRAKHPTYMEQERRRGEPPTEETADFAKFPTFTAFRSDLATLGRQLSDVEGTKKLGQQILAVADDVTDAYIAFAKENLLNLAKLSTFGVGDKVAEFANRESAERAIRRSKLVGKAIVLPIKRGVNRIIMSPSEAMARGIWTGDGDKRITLKGEFGAHLVETIGRRANSQNRLTVPWQFENAHQKRKALARLGIETPSEFRSALREFIRLQERAVSNRVRELELSMVGRKNDGLDFFPTPQDVADQMVEAAEITPDMAVLEPSAGMGHLADRIRAAGAEPDVIEVSAERRELLEEKGYYVPSVTDFLALEPRKSFTFGDVFRAPDGTEGIMRGQGGMGSSRVRLEDEAGTVLGLYDRSDLEGVRHRGVASGYDRIVMNPPFSKRRDAEHVRHAYELLRPGGRIVAIMGEGVFFGSDKKAQEFREWLESVSGTSEKLEAGSFMDPSLPVNTGVNARMVVIDKADPNASAAPPPAGNFSRPLTESREAQVDQTKTPEFKAWFGDSKVVDAEGRPLVVYHGTAREFDQFDSDQNYGELDAFWFTDSRGYAQWIADGPSRRTASPGARVVDAFLSIKNPMVFDVLAEGRKVAEEIGVDAPSTSMEAQEILSGGLGWDSVVADIVSDAKKVGHDGVVIENFNDNFPGGDTTAYLAFSSEQIKSATGNRGTFDPTDPRITFSQPQPGDRIPMGPLRSETAMRLAVAAALDSWNGSKPIVRVVRTPKELPADAKMGEGWQTAEGYFDGDGGVWLVTENLSDPQRALEVLRHEAVGHFGVERIAGAAWPSIVAGVEAMRGQKRTGMSKPMAAALAEAEARYEAAASDDPLLFAKELIAVMAETGTRASFMDRMLSQLRVFLRKAGLIGEAFSEAELRNVLSGAFRLVERGGSLTAGAPVAAGGLQSARPDDVAAYILRMMGKSDADLFRYPKSDSTSFAKVIKDVSRGEVSAVKLGDVEANFTENLDDMLPAVKWGLRLPDGSQAFVYVEQPSPYTPSTGQRMFLDASAGNSGASLGSAVYAGLFQWALNTGHTFIGDPNGLSTEALLRRTEHMLSAALKHGTTRMMAPHDRQIDPMDKKWGPSQEWAHPLQWTDGDDVGNITALIRTSVENHRGLLKGTEADGAVYRLSDGQFLGAGGQPLTDKGLRRAAATAGARFRASGRFAGPESRAAAVGGSTVARTLVLGSLLDRSTGSTGERRALLADLAERLSAQSLTYDRARGMFYSRPGPDQLQPQDQTQTPEFKRWFGDSKVVDADGRPLVVYHGTNQAFDSFEQERLGSMTQAVSARAFFFTDAAEEASGYADLAASRMIPDAKAHEAKTKRLMKAVEAAERRGNWSEQERLTLELEEHEYGAIQADPEGANVVPVYLSIRNPMRVRVGGMISTGAVSDYIDRARAEGRDGLILEEIQDGPKMGGDPTTHYVAFRPGQIKSATGNRGTFDPADPRITFSRPRAAMLATRQRVQQLTSRETIDKLIYEFQDKFVDLKRIQAHIRESGGTVSDLNDAYLGEELYHSRVMARHESFMSSELKPLLADLNAAGFTVEQFEQFLHARHAPEANAVLMKRNPDGKTVQAERDRTQQAVRALQLQLQQAQNSGMSTRAIEQALQLAEEEQAHWKRVQPFKGTDAERAMLSGMSDADAAAVMAALAPADRAKMDALAGRIDAINAKTLDHLERYGLMSRADLDAWRQAYQFYVPLHRDEANPDSASHPTGAGFSVRGDAAKSRTGSAKAKVTHILAHIAMQREAAITRGEKNAVAKKLYVLAGQNPDPNLWTLDKAPTITRVDPDTGTVRTMPDPMYRQKPNVVMVRIAGEDRAIVFNERNTRALRLAESLKNLDVDDLHVVLGWFSKATRWLASVNTQYNPVFGIVNLIRDTQGVALQLSTTPLKGKEAQVLRRIPALLRSIYRERRGKGARSPEDARNQRLWDEMRMTGGVTGYRDLFRDPMERANAIEAELQKAGRGMASRAAHAVVDWLSDYNEAIENATRLAAYEQGLAQGLTKERAASIAKNITVNFNRKGRQTRELGALFAFFNAAVQGTTRMVETLAGPRGRAIMAGGVALGFVNSLIGLAVMGGDEWEKIPEHVKERAVIIPISGKDYISIPMPLGYHVFPNIGRIAAEMMTGSNDTAAGSAGELLRIGVDSFNPLGGTSTPLQMLMPTALDPVAALAENKDWTGRPIYREDFSSTDPTPGFTRSKDSASMPAKVIAWGANAITGGDDYEPGAFSPTPDQIDYVIGQLTGGLGREILKAQTTITAPITGEELPAYKIPLVSRLYGNTRGQAGESERFYSALRELNIVERRMKGMARAGEDVDAYMAAEPLTGLVGMGTRSQSVVQRLRSAQRQATAAGDSEQAEAIRAQITEIMAELNREVRAAKQ